MRLSSLIICKNIRFRLSKVVNVLNFFQMIPIFTDPLKNYKALRGTAATFSCTVDGLPKPKVS